MPVKITYTTNRPSKYIAFYGEEFWKLDEIVSYMKATYEDTGKLLYTSFEDSEDTLTHTWIEYWDSQESAEQFWADSFLNQGMVTRSNYRTENNIVMTHVIENIDSSLVPTKL